MRVSIVTLVLLGFVTLGPSTARAQGYFSPSVGYDFGGDAGECPSFFNDCTTRKTSYGLTAGYLSAGIIGFEADFSYAPDFFGKSASFGDNSVLTLMGNLVLGIPAGPLRPYLSAGIGMISTRVTFNTDTLVDSSQTGFGYDVGAGVMIFLPFHLGIRGDFRHLRSTKETSLLGIGLPTTKLNFSRASVGIVLH